MSEHSFDPRAIANLIWQYGKEDGRLYSNVSIQKLLYFAHASFLVKTGQPLVKGVFEAWDYGPVSRPVYQALKEYGRQPVTEPISKVDIFTGEVTPIHSPTNRRVISHITQVVDTLGKLSPGKLIDLSHKKGGAWDLVWNKSKTSATFGNRISDKLTIRCYDKLMIGLSESIEEEDKYEATPFTGHRNS